MSRISRRGRPALIVLTGMIAVVALVVAASPTAPLLPAFRFERLLFDPLDRPLRYDPTGESIFPSVVRVAGRLPDALGDYYLYYAPHDVPGGISMAYADHPAGPWTEYAANPVIGAVWTPYYSVSHVSSPDALIADDGRLLIYFHGENDTTRVASSDDGVTFRYEGEAVTIDDVPGATEASYARVGRHASPDLADRYVMTFMVTGADDRRRIHLATSDDGLDWTVRPQPLVAATPDEGPDLSGATYLNVDGHHLVVYGTSSGAIHATDVGPRFLDERHLGIFFEDPSERAAAPEFLEVDGTQYLFYERGPRRDARLALATTEARP